MSSRRVALFRGELAPESNLGLVNNYYFQETMVGPSENVRVWKKTTNTVWTALGYLVATSSGGGGTTEILTGEGLPGDVVVSPTPDLIYIDRLARIMYQYLSSVWVPIGALTDNATTGSMTLVTDYTTITNPVNNQIVIHVDHGIYQYNSTTSQWNLLGYTTITEGSMTLVTDYTTITNPVDRQIVIHTNMGVYQYNMGTTSWDFVGYLTKTSGSLVQVQDINTLTPVEGQIAVHTDLGIYQYDGAVWVLIGYTTLTSGSMLRVTDYTTLTDVPQNQLVLHTDGGVYQYAGTSWTLIGYLSNTLGSRLLVTDYTTITNPVASQIVIHTDLGVYQYNGTSWVLVGRLVNTLGSMVFIGDYSTIASPQTGQIAVHTDLGVYQYSGTSWTLVGRLTNTLGSQTIVVDYTTIGSPVLGQLVVHTDLGMYRYSGTSWVLVGYLANSLGSRVLVTDYTTVTNPVESQIVVHTDLGLYQYVGTSWTLVGSLVSTLGSQTLVADYTSLTSMTLNQLVIHTDLGVYRYNGTSWVLEGYLSRGPQIIHVVRGPNPIGDVVADPYEGLHAIADDTGEFWYYTSGNWQLIANLNTQPFQIRLWEPNTNYYEASSYGDIMLPADIVMFESQLFIVLSDFASGLTFEERIGGNLVLSRIRLNTDLSYIELVAAATQPILANQELGAYLAVRDYRIEPQHVLPNARINGAQVYHRGLTNNTASDAVVQIKRLDLTGATQIVGTLTFDTVLSNGRGPTIVFSDTRDPSAIVMNAGEVLTFVITTVPIDLTGIYLNLLGTFIDFLSPYFNLPE